mmetsp:Transcript_50437/g.83014  ORF Transcript_50437/g.83014 Transcript_50437/m.83014 type:complete len:208 (-) Transcript_50437:1088-1711(-)
MNQAQLLQAETLAQHSIEDLQKKEKRPCRSQILEVLRAMSFPQQDFETRNKGCHAPHKTSRTTPQRCNVPPSSNLTKLLPHLPPHTFHGPSSPPSWLCKCLQALAAQSHKRRSGLPRSASSVPHHCQPPQFCAAHRSFGPVRGRRPCASAARPRPRSLRTPHGTATPACTWRQRTACISQRRCPGVSASPAPASRLARGPSQCPCLP